MTGSLVLTLGKPHVNIAGEPPEGCAKQGRGVLMSDAQVEEYKYLRERKKSAIYTTMITR